MKEHTPDLVILDAMLPELHGFDIARRIKGTENYGHIPIVMICAVYSGWRFAEDLQAELRRRRVPREAVQVADVSAAVERAARAVAGERGPERLLREPRRSAKRTCQQGIEAYQAGDIDQRDRAAEEGDRASSRSPTGSASSWGCSTASAGRSTTPSRSSSARRHQPEALPRAEEPGGPLPEGGLPEQGGRDVGAVRAAGPGRSDPAVDQGAPDVAGVGRGTTTSTSTHAPCRGPPGRPQRRGTQLFRGPDVEQMGVPAFAKKSYP